ncbi:MAG: ThiF family adenylyltransferase [Fimbriimonadales bacterium]|nr:ThiF family adenylyltransferase [Fimbriimonadales bacterium]MDW8052407.1 ThiF family adenylyltransferase [Armatimonadota bacterium]
MLVGEVRLPQGLWIRLSETLLADCSVETKAFLLCRTLESETRVVFLARELIEVPPEAYAQRTEDRVEIRPEFVHQVLVRCAREGYALLEAHSHPWMPNPRFSKIDDYSDLQKFMTTQSMSPPFRHGSLVFGSDMSFEGRFWDYQRQQMAPIVRLRVLRTPLETRYGTGLYPPHLQEAERAVYDRQVRAFGTEGQTILGTLRVAIVGAGGLGSQIANALALLGVGQLLLVDPDRLELSNLNRVVGASYAQALRRWRKVYALAQRLNRARPPELRTIVPLPFDGRTPRALSHLLSCDVIVGAVDSAVVRQYLNTVAACALIPYLDAGVGIRSEHGRLQQGGGQVQVIVPGATACLACVERGIRQSVEEQLTPHQRALAIRGGYIQGEAIPNPQVVFLNGVVGNLLAWELVKLATGCAPVQPYVYYDLLSQQVFPARAERNPDCLLCAEHPNSLLGQGLYGLVGYLQTPRSRARRAKPIPQPRGE